MSRLFAISQFLTLLLTSVIVMLVGCASMTSSTRPELLTNYNTLAVFGLSESQEVYFIAEYMALSPGQTFIERRRIAELIAEQDLLPDRLNAVTRAKIKEIFGVDALVLAQISGYDLSVRIVDSETGDILSATSTRVDWTVKTAIGRVVSTILK